MTTPTLAELEAQQAALSLAFAQNDKDHIDAIVAATTGETVTGLIALLETHLGAMSTTNPAAPRVRDLINVLTQCPALYQTEAARLAAVIAAAEPAGE